MVVKFVGFRTAFGAKGGWIVEEGFPTLLNQNQTWSWIYCENGMIPLNAVVGGYEDHRTVYVARVRTETGVIPGQLIETHTLAEYGKLNGLTTQKREYEMLCNFSGTWIPASNGRVPPKAIVGGQLWTGEILYIARAHQDNRMIPGYVRTSFDTAFIPWAGGERRYRIYEVLSNW